MSLIEYLMRNRPRRRSTIPIYLDERPVDSVNLEWELSTGARSLLIAFLYQAYLASKLEGRERIGFAFSGVEFSVYQELASYLEKRTQHGVEPVKQKVEELLEKGKCLTRRFAPY